MRVVNAAPQLRIGSVTSALALLTTLGIGLGGSDAAASDQHRSSTALLSILNAVSDDASFASVDVYADRELIAQDLQPGDLDEAQLKPGRYDITVVPAGSPRREGDLLSADTMIRLTAGQNRTMALHLSPRGSVTSTVFTNRTRTVGRDMSQLTFRHIARAPDVDVRTRGSVLMDSVSNGQQADEGLRSGTYRIRVVREGSRNKVLPASNHRLYNAPGRQDMGENRIVYLWGSSPDDSLALAVQEIELDLN